MEHYYTIQGEGHFQGHAAYFIRLAGCDVHCFWCDVKESWDAHQYTKIPITQIIHHVAKSSAKRVVITGGEPLLYDLTTLTTLLKKYKYRTHLETSGAHRLSGCFDWICVSPKKFLKPEPTVVQAAHELKIIIHNKSDFEWAMEWARQVSPECLLFLQPEWSKAAQITPMIIQFIKENTQWVLSLQMHKYIDIP